MFGSCSIDLEKRSILLPVYAFAFCMWTKAAHFAKDVRKFAGGEGRSFTKMIGKCIYLSKLAEIETKNREGLDGNVEDGRCALKNI